MDSNEIKAIIQNYFDAGFECDGEKMRGVFHNAAHIYGIGDGGVFQDRDKEAFIKLVETPKGGYPRHDEVLSIDFIDENTAVARIKTRIGNILFTDNLSFLRLDGKWSVITKLFAGEPAIH